MKFKILLGTFVFMSLTSCSGGSAAANLSPGPSNSSECVAPASTQLVDRLSRLPQGVSPQQAEELMQRQSDEGYVAFAAAGDRGTMTWTESRGGRTIEARVDFQASAATDRSVAVRQEEGGEELICIWFVQ